MILQALTQYYEDLRANGDVAGPGWGKIKISYILYLNINGEIEQVIPQLVEEKRGNKTVLQPAMILLPAPVKRTVSISSNFLWDNSAYLLGLDNKGNNKRAKECFENCKQLHIKLLSGLKEPCALAVRRFFESWDPDNAANSAVLQEYYEDLLSGCNIAFKCGGQAPQESNEVREVWEKYYLSSENGHEGICLVTGKREYIEPTHPLIKGIRNAQSSGAALVSFNAPAFESYGKSQNYNAPTSQYAAFAYTTALNYLIAQREYVNYISDTAVLCWAEGGKKEYQGLLDIFAFGSEQKAYTEQEILEKVRRLARGEAVQYNEEWLDPSCPFYILGISPNAARLSVRFFMKDSFGDILEHVNAHYQRMEIVHSRESTFRTIPLWKMLSETINKNATDKSPEPNMAGAVLRAIMLNERYPATLLNNVNLRIRAEHDVTWGRAAIIKAYYLKNRHKDVPEEVLQVSLNPDSKNTAYNLGRLFSILENIQQKANPGINATIKDKYFNSAAATPGMVFPYLINLSQKHLKKIGGGLKVVLEKELSEILGRFEEGFPQRMNLQQQGAFQLGYYHQKENRYQLKNKEEE